MALKYRYNEIKDVKTLAVTGSVGKTTTKEMIHLAMSGTFDAYKSPGNMNSLTGMPMAILNISPHTEWAALELGMNQRSEIRKLSLLVRPETAVVTNIGWSHIEALGSIENIRDEKLDIIEGMTYNGTLLLNGDDEMLRNAVIKTRKPFYYSIGDENSDFKAFNITETEEGVRFGIRYDGGEQTVCLRAKGKHIILDALAGFSAAVMSGADAKNAAAAISEFSPENNRQKIEDAGGITLIIDCYNASPTSIKAALETMKDMNCSGKRIAVIGDMLELGAYSEKLHRLVGEYAASSGADLLLCVGDESRFIADQAEKLSFPKEKTVRFGRDEYSKAAEYLNSVSEKGDIILFKASNRMELGIIADSLKKLKSC
ncbi:MAG: UDP-N-acetylmuramoyl-tripeptide--D-alanyl-D-alanine ligase, partial [Clostridia bacterium]|nr:UDP-N-acetylmuramoyl-tripeptide--D-alanyl-D-alanine ligase [Clostridia bacterium]